ncbi:MAG TPA: hypothetical protein VGL22_09445 [Terracidiphilus sp.]|jgi:hypothetical protein
MEADWEFEIAPEAPVIDGAWSGLVDLRAHPEGASRLPEASTLPALAGTLTSLNADASPVWTAKCDIWNPGAVDPDELETTPEAAAHALSCYIDLIPSSDAWSTLDHLADWCSRLCVVLRGTPLRQCRADLVVRSAFLTPAQTALGITLYVTGCGATDAAAAEALSSALNLLARTITSADA